MSNSSQKNKHALHTLLAVTQVRQFLRLKTCPCLPKQNWQIYRFFRILQFMSFTMIFGVPRFSVKQRAQEDSREAEHFHQNLSPARVEIIWNRWKSALKLYFFFIFTSLLTRKQQNRLNPEENIGL